MRGHGKFYLIGENEMRESDTYIMGRQMAVILILNSYLLNVLFSRWRRIERKSNANCNKSRRYKPPENALSKMLNRHRKSIDYGGDKVWMTSFILVFELKQMIFFCIGWWLTDEYRCSLDWKSTHVMGSESDRGKKAREKFSVVYICMSYVVRVQYITNVHKE